ncbi:hypothetical protein V1525DRAFT_404978 [Lipomyces kononenkoae]|uniref:Uncharacterized protein n=1 Tax=Lipomyces kononenkoae TaxID=34357 RepID=A0ACC3T0R6_LIPKO
MNQSALIYFTISYICFDQALRRQNTNNNTMLIKKTNDIISKQWYYQANPAHRELWMRHPRSALYVIPYWVAFWGGLGYASYYLGRMVIGKKD